MTVAMVATREIPAGQRREAATRADYASSQSDTVTLCAELRAFGAESVAESVGALNERAAWERLAELATSGY